MAEREGNSGPDAENRKRRFLLVVDSDSDSLSYLSVLLNRFNYPSFKAATAREAIETAATALPFLVVTSLHLPDMHGFDLIQQFKDSAGTAHIPVIAVSRQNDLNVRKRCLDLGAVGCLYHPVEAETLYRVVQVAVEKNPRSCMRIRTTQPVKVTDARHDNFYGAHTLDLSERGMYLRTVNAAPVKAALSLQIDLNGRSIPAEGEVLYSCMDGEGPYQEQGIGMRFSKIEPNDQAFLRQFIRDEVTKGLRPLQA